ncbi:ImmA/IrrE family metallo-endopeptidase [Microbacterium oryzae]|jgi:Zn-dependent peptidase ImmA (M78 family)|uniref:ImmA/IrrE family metallo-endopeptidase n=1 Tax=Microbacterium oryzae TaxID=743009 RepID=UPI0025B2102B|nr:ImmA/IrrE family metallo-endopeptidase [Microbacterium oryzae]MDN3309597.1 ImmA/IrrE family metallo-endopeptidase [Microbacterium oryzae]
MALTEWDLIDYVATPEGLSSRTSTAYMYGVGNFEDGICAADYDPWVHAEQLDLPIIFRDLPDADMVAAYSHEHRAIFVRTGLHGATERCSIAHEIVHFERNDVGEVKAQEDRADRISARRLIRPSRVRRVASMTGNDPAAIALELNVTEQVMRTWLRMVRQGVIKGY